MYTQALSSQAPVEAVPGANRPEDAEQAARFQARIDAEERIEPKDWMPEAYRQTLIRQITQHAHSEIVGMLPEGNWITRAPTPAPQGGAAGQGAGRGRPRPLPLCRRRDAGRLARGAGRCAARRARPSTRRIFNYPTLTWADIGAIGWLVDGAAIMNQIPLLPLLLRPLRARHDPRLQGRELPPAPGLRDHADAVPRARPSRRRWRRTR